MRCLELKIPPLPQLITVGKAVWQPGMQHFERSFSVYDLLYIRSGRMYMTEDDTSYELGAHELLVLEPGRTHRGHRPCEEDTLIYWFHFLHPHPPVEVESGQVSWSGLLRRGTDQDLLPGEQAMYIPKHAVIEPGLVVPVFEEMNHLHRAVTRGNALRLQVAAGELLGRLQDAARGSEKSRTFLISEKVVGYLHERVDRPFSADEMEQELMYSFDYLARCLKLHTGLSPVQYLHRLQVERAKTLLRSSDLSLQEIAERVGQPNVNYFIRMFRRQLGMPPGAYRALRQEGV